MAARPKAKQKSPALRAPRPPPAPRRATAAALRKRLLTFSLGLPEAYEDHPWGETVAKVNNKVFVFLGHEKGHADGFGMSVKLPESGSAVLSLPFTEPTGYGLGKSGWVTVKLPATDLPPAELCEEWILESYRAVAPKKLVRALDAE